MITLEEVIRPRGVLAVQFSEDEEGEMERIGV
jgi:hypothetical protein